MYIYSYKARPFVVLMILFLVLVPRLMAVLGRPYEWTVMVRETITIWVLMPRTVVLITVFLSGNSVRIKCIAFLRNEHKIINV
jgi:small-conductance mechanosensitive channel